MKSTESAKNGESTIGLIRCTQAGQQTMSGYYQTSYKSKDSMNKLGKEPLLPETQGDLEVGGGWNGFSDQKTINVEMQIRLQFIRKVI